MDKTGNLIRPFGSQGYLTGRRDEEPGLLPE
jgi:hypothetical protein